MKRLRAHPKVVKGIPVSLFRLHSTRKKGSRGALLGRKGGRFFFGAEIEVEIDVGAEGEHPNHQAA